MISHVGLSLRFKGCRKAILNTSLKQIGSVSFGLDRGGRSRFFVAHFLSWYYNIMGCYTGRE